MSPLTLWLGSLGSKKTMFADWGAEDWSEDLEAARLQALEWVSATASARGWDPMDQYNADAIVEASADAATSAQGFWNELVESWGTGPGYPPGWDKLLTSFSQAAGTARSVSAGRESGKVGSVLSGGLQGTVDDLNPKKSWIPWAIGGTVILGLYAWRKL